MSYATRASGTFCLVGSKGKKVAVQKVECYNRVYLLMTSFLSLELRYVTAKFSRRFLLFPHKGF